MKPEDADAIAAAGTLGCGGCFIGTLLLIKPLILLLIILALVKWIFY